MTITFWNGHPLHGGRQIPGEVTHEADGTITFRSHEGGTYRDVYVCDENGKTVEVWPAQRGSSPTAWADDEVGTGGWVDHG